MLRRNGFVGRSARILAVLGVFLGLVAAPAQAALPSSTASSVTLHPTSGNNGVARQRALPMASPAQKRGAASSSPATLAVAPAAARSGTRTTTSASWTALGPRPQVDERCCGSAPVSFFGNVSGRVTSLAVDPTNPSTAYAGEADGGVWKTTNGGTQWTALTDDRPSLAIGALGISADGRTIYAGTGEANFSEDSLYGQGILVSTDAGASWTLTGQTTLAGTHIGSIAVDSTNSGHALAATDVGLFSTSNGGLTWTRDTAIDSAITRIGPGPFGVTQVVQAPDNPLQWWAVASDTCINDAGDILVSGDGGNTWASSFSAPGKEGQIADRIAIGVGTGGVVYAALGTCSGTLLDIQKLTGTTWTSIMGGLNGFDYFTFSGSDTAGQAWYDNVVAVDPASNNRAVFGGVTIVATSNGGSTYTDVGRVYSGGFVHPDYHAIDFFGASSFYVGNDGGVWKTTDLGGSGSQGDWTDLNNTLQTIQYYHGTAPDLAHIVGGSQDNGTSGNLPGAPSLPAFQSYLGGDGGFTALDPSHGTIYGEYLNGVYIYLVKSTETLNPGDPFSPYDNSVLASPCDPDNPVQPACSDPVAFDAPFRMDSTNPQRLIAGTNKVYQTLDGGATWTAISGDLTTGGTIVRADHLTALTMGQQAGQTGIIYTGSLAGKVERTTNDGATWVDITGNLPAFSFTNFVNLAWITSIAFNPANPQEAWVTIGGVGVPHVWHTANAGATPTTWTPMDGSGATAVPNAPVLSVVQGVASPATLYIGTYYGVMACESCTGPSPNPAWTPLGSGLPNVTVWDLSQTNDGSTLVAWTHGRGAWSYRVQTPPTRVYLPRIVNKASPP